MRSRLTLLLAFTLAVTQFPGDVSALQPADPALLGALKGRLASPDARVRTEALAAILELGEAARPLHGTVLEATHDRDLTVRAAAFRVIEAMEPSASQLPALLMRLEADNYNERFGAVLTLRKLGPLAAEATPLLAEMLSSREGMLAIAAAEALESIGPDAAPAVPALLAALDHPRASDQAIEALGGIRAVEAVPALTAIATGKREGSSLYALRALARLGPAAAPAAAELATMVREDRRDDDAMEALVAIGSEAIPHLKELATGSDTRVQRLALEGLGQLGPAASTVVPALIESYTGHSNPPVLLSALVRIDRDAVATLLAAQDHRKARVRMVESLARMGLKGVDGLPLLVDLLDDPDDYLRSEAARGIGRMGPAAVSAHDRLAPLLDDPVEFVRLSAVKGLGGLGPISTTEVDRIAALLEVEDRHTRKVAIEALGRMGPAAAAAVPALIGELQRTDGHCLETARVLQGIGPAAKPALKALRKAMPRVASWERAALADIVRKIEAAAGTDPAH